MNLHYKTVSNLLNKTLVDLMKMDELSSFRLVGGTALSLYLGHRMSEDIDLFSDAEYGSIDFEVIERKLQNQFRYFDKSGSNIFSFGKSYLVGENPIENIKLDIYYTDPFVFDEETHDGIRMATIEEIIAMKVDVISRGGRKKDFWDLHELLPRYSLNKMIDLHEMRYPYSHDSEKIKKQLVSFEAADEDFDPVCLRGNIWELIKMDIVDAISG